MASDKCDTKQPVAALIKALKQTQTSHQNSQSSHLCKASSVKWNGTLVKYHNTMALTRISQIGDMYVTYAQYVSHCHICTIVTYAQYVSQGFAGRYIYRYTCEIVKCPMGRTETQIL